LKLTSLIFKVNGSDELGSWTFAFGWSFFSPLFLLETSIFTFTFDHPQKGTDF